MAYQTTPENNNTFVLGSGIVYFGSTAAAATNSVGLVRDIVLTENFSKVSSQADNGADPVQRVARHTCTISFSLLEFWPPTFDDLRGNNFDTENASTAGTYVASTANIISTGGFSELTNIAIKIINSTMYSGATTQTAIVVYKASVDEGMNLSFISDNADDQIMPIPLTFTGILDTSRTEGDQLYIIESDMGL